MIIQLIWKIRQNLKKWELKTNTLNPSNEKISKVNKLLSKLIKRENITKKKTTKVRDEEDVSTASGEVQRIIGKYVENLYSKENLQKGTIS